VARDTIGGHERAARFSERASRERGEREAEGGAPACGLRRSGEWIAAHAGAGLGSGETSLAPLVSEEALATGDLFA
jgi:hypothetical protein